MQTFLRFNKKLVKILSLIGINYINLYNCIVQIDDKFLSPLTFTTLWADSADDKMMIFFPENGLWHFMLSP